MSTVSVQLWPDYPDASGQKANRAPLGPPRPKVLFTSGYTEFAAEPDRRARTDPLLSKPYRKQDLGRAVRAVLD